MAEKRIVKVGIIGCGGIANGKHLPALAKLPNVQMVAFCDIIVERAETARLNTAPPMPKSTRTTRICWLMSPSRWFTSAPPTAPTASSR